jgi:hypothetical protein
MRQTSSVFKDKCLSWRAAPREFLWFLEKFPAGNFSENPPLGLTEGLSKALIGGAGTTKNPG